MLNRVIAVCLCIAEVSADRPSADEVSWLQSSRTSRIGSWRSAGLLQETTLRDAVSLAQSMSRLDRDDARVIYLLFGGILVTFLVLLLCFVKAAWDTSERKEVSELRRPHQVPWIQPTESIQQEALPAICPKLMSAKHQPLLVPLKPIQESDEWSLKIYSQHQQRAVLVATLKRRNAQRQRSFLEMRCGERDELLGIATSQLEILLPDGRPYGRLAKHKGAHRLQEATGREARWSMAEEEGTICVVWLPKKGSGTRMAQDLKDGLLKQGGRQPTRHSQKGTVVATVARPEGSNGHRLELHSLAGVDDVLVILCALALVTFDGMMDLVDAENVKSETGLEAKWSDPSPAVDSVDSSQSGSSYPKKG